MLHTVYLAALCSRRSWPEPAYRLSTDGYGFSCVVRVNNREYQTSKHYGSDTAAKEAAALTAYTICRSFSVNDGMYPTGFDHGGVIQGTPVPVGAGRRNAADEMSMVYRYRGDSDTSSRSGGSSPDLVHQQQIQYSMQMPSMTTQMRRPAPVSNGNFSSRRHEPRYGRHGLNRH